MGKSKDLATGNSAAYVETAGDTMSGALNVNGGNLSINSTSEAAHRYLYLNTGATNDGHILFQRGGAAKYQISADTSNNLFTWNYTKNGTSFRINADGSIIMPHQPSFHAKLSSNQTGFNATSLCNHFITFDSEVVDKGNNHSGGVFTAPVAGTYFFKAEVYGSVNFTQAWLCINGGRSVGTDTVYITATNFAYYENIVHLSANDTVSFHPYHSSNSSVTINANNNHTWWKGHFLG